MYYIGHKQFKPKRMKKKIQTVSCFVLFTFFISSCTKDEVSPLKIINRKNLNEVSNPLPPQPNYTQ